MKFITALIASICTLVGFYMLSLASRCLALFIDAQNPAIAVSLLIGFSITLALSGLCLIGAFKSKVLVRHFVTDAA